MDQYKSSYPSTPEVPPSLRLYFEAFYEISDTPEAHEKYVDCFTKDAIVVMASVKAEGSDGGSLSFTPNCCPRVSCTWKEGRFHGLEDRYQLVLEYLPHL